MSPSDADIVTKLCTQLDCALAATRTACGERTAAHSTIEKSREVTNCPQGVDLQDHLKQLVDENAALKKFCRNAAFDADYEAELGMERGGFTDAFNDIKTPATDSTLREAEARGVEKFGEHVKAYNHSAGWQSKHFAEQLREGKA